MVSMRAVKRRQQVGGSLNLLPLRGLIFIYLIPWVYFASPMATCCRHFVPLAITDFPTAAWLKTLIFQGQSILTD